MTTEQKLEALGRAGMQGVAVVRFTHELSHWEPETFVRTVLVEWLHVAEVWVGANFLFGHNRAGNFSRAPQPRRPLRLPRREDRSGPLQGLRRQQHARAPAASAEGRVDEAGGAARPSLLHRRHRRARRRPRARASGFPTANSAPRTSCLPPSGVYATTVTIDGIVHPSVTNIGMRPTFGDVDRPVDRDAHLRRSIAICTISGCGCRSCSGCATSARFPTSTRCARRSRPTAAARGGCSAAFRCRIVRYARSPGPRRADLVLRLSVPAAASSRSDRGGSWRPRSPSTLGTAPPTPGRPAHGSKR